ncbi:MAG: XTP/dITP diphosphohydrolase [Thermoplasmata archaeon]|jgi:XTP/dITP diphosphohydrolase|nr:XTP/dITP diphosphohydrolase [Thermoplasmata archaeon]
MPRVDLPGHSPTARHREPAASPPSAPSASAAPQGRPTKLTFVTGNAGKVAEMAALLAPLGVEVVADGRGYPEVQAATLAEVTEAGARHLLAAGLRPPFILEDSGLFVAALRGFPGVYSRNALDTIGTAGILRLLQDVELETRGAAFQADLAYVDAAGRVHHFAGTCKGRIAERAAGSNGFGFDPVFVPHGESLTFAEMDPAEKSRLSHRGQTAMLLARHLAGAPGGTASP